MKNIKEKVIAPLSLFFAPLLAFAQTPAPITTVSGLVNIICRAFAYMFYGLIAISLVMVLVAAYGYVTAGDNAEKVGKANKTILYAAIGIAVALLAKGIPLIVASFFSASGNIQSC